MNLYSNSAMVIAICNDARLAGTGSPPRPCRRTGCRARGIDRLPLRLYSVPAVSIR